MNHLKSKTLSFGDINIRPLLLSDYDHGYLDLFKAFTNDISYSYSRFVEFFDNYTNSNRIIYVVENNEKQLIATITILIEQKPFHNYQYVAHIEDVIVDKCYKKHGIGSKMVNFIIDTIKEVNKTAKNHFYKIILDCDVNVEQFYIKNGFTTKGCFMRIDV